MAGDIDEPKPKEKNVPSFKILSHEGISPPRPDGKIYIRCVFGLSPLGDEQTHEFEYTSKQELIEGVRNTEAKFEAIDYCHLSISPAFKADPQLGKTAMDNRKGKLVSIDLASVVTSISIQA